MTKFALCLEKIEDLNNLVTGKEETIILSLQDREVCEKPENGFIQIIPYVSIYAVKKEEGKIELLHYIRASDGDEERLQSKVSVGFGGHIDQLDEIEPFAEVSFSDDETGVQKFTVNKEGLKKIIQECAKRELIEELGVDVFTKYEIEISDNDIVFFMGDQNSDVNKVHIAAGILIELNTDELTSLLDNDIKTSEEIETIDKLNCNIDLIVPELDYSATMSNILKSLAENSSMEDWSLKMFDFITRKTISSIFYGLTYETMLEAVRLSQQKAKQDGVEQGDQPTVN